MTYTRGTPASFILCLFWDLSWRNCTINMHYNHDLFMKLSTNRDASHMRQVKQPDSCKSNVSLTFYLIFQLCENVYLMTPLFPLSRCKMAQSSGWGVMVSHRSGETEDTFIADLVVGLCTGQVRGFPKEILLVFNCIWQLKYQFVLYSHITVF